MEIDWGTVFIIAVMFLVFALIIHDQSLPETQQAKYKNNEIIDDLSMEIYNKNYSELNEDEKNSMIRQYRLREYFGKDTYYIPVPIPT